MQHLALKVPGLTALFLIFACGSSPTAPGDPAPQRIVLTTDAEGGSARPEIASTSDRVFVLYLANIADPANRRFDVRIFDSSLAAVVATKSLVRTTTSFGGPTDIRVASDGQYLYAFYETAVRSTDPHSRANHLWGAKYALNDAFTLVASTTSPITTSKPWADLPEGGELVDDPAPLVTPASVFVVTRLKYSLAKAGRTAYRVRELSREDLRPLQTFDLDLSDAADGRARVASLWHRDGSVYIALATTVADQVTNEDNDDGAESDIVLVKMTAQWTFEPSADLHVLTAEPGDRENYVTGLKGDGHHLYLTYKQAVGAPPTGEQRAMIKIFDANFTLVDQKLVKSVAWGPEGGEIRPSLEVQGSRLLSGQSGGQGIGVGNAEVYVYTK